MKKTRSVIIVIMTLVAIHTTNAQMIWDDFSTGAIKPIATKAALKTIVSQEHSQLPGAKRTLTYEVGENPYNQYFQLQTKDNALIVSSGYGMAASIKIGYGGLTRGAMNKDLSAYKVMKISFKGKSNFARVYVNMWSNGPNRALWYGNGQDLEPFYGSIEPNGSNRGKVITIPLNQLKNKNGKFKITDVDAVQVNLLGFETTGVNYALDKIWFE